MDHHGGMSEPMCSMNMLFTWDTTNLCIIFRQWRITGLGSLIWSLVAIALLTAGYEAVRELARRYETGIDIGTGFSGLGKRNSDDGLEADDETSLPLLRNGRSGNSSKETQRRRKIARAAFYAIQVFYSFFIMLLFMTYNGWVMLSVAAGAFIGFIVFSDSSATKSAACH